jgi:phosphoenolpyruvate carboxylase
MFPGDTSKTTYNLVCANPTETPWRCCVDERSEVAELLERQRQRPEQNKNHCATSTDYDDLTQRLPNQPTISTQTRTTRQQQQQQQ